MINGVPVNDMENGRVYWSNWAGLSDVTSAMQVQRGLGASKVAVPSIGGCFYGKSCVWSEAAHAISVSFGGHAPRPSTRPLMAPRVLFAFFPENGNHSLI